MAGRGPEPEQRGVSERVTAGFKARRNHGWGQNGPGGNPRGTGLDNDTPPALIIVAGADGGVNFIDGPVVRAERKGSRPRSNRPDSTIAAPDMRTIFRGTDEIERFRQIYSQPIIFKNEDNRKANPIPRAATEGTVYENVKVAPKHRDVDRYRNLQELQRIALPWFIRMGQVGSVETAILAEIAQRASDVGAQSVDLAVDTLSTSEGRNEALRKVTIAGEVLLIAGSGAACAVANPSILSSPVQTGAAASEKAAQTTVAVVYNRVVGDPQKTLEAASGVLFGAKTPAASGSEPKPIGPQAKGTPQTPARNEATSAPKPIVESTPISQVVIEIKPSQWSEVVKAIQNDDNWSGFEGVAQILGPNLIVVAPKRSDIYGSSILLVIGDDGKVRDARDISNFASATPTKYLVTHTFMSDLGKNGSHLDNPILITVSYYLPDRKSQKLAELIKDREVDENFMRLSGPDGKPFIVYVDNTGKIIAAWDVKNEKMQFPGDKDFQLAEKQPVIIASIDPKALGDLQENDSVITQVRNSNGEVEYYLGPAPAPAAIIEVPNPTATAPATVAPTKTEAPTATATPKSEPTATPKPKYEFGSGGEFSAEIIPGQKPGPDGMFRVYIDNSAVGEAFGFRQGNHSLEGEVWIDNLSPQTLGPYQRDPWLSLMSFFDDIKIFHPSVMVNLVGSPGNYYLQTYSGGNYYRLSKNAPGVSLNSWIKIRVDVDVDNKIVRTYQDGILVSEGPYDSLSKPGMAGYHMGLYANEKVTSAKVKNRNVHGWIY